MKRPLFIALIILINTSVFAQLEKGKVLLNASLNYSKNEILLFNSTNNHFGDQKQFNTGIGGEVLLNNSVSVGIYLDYQRSTTKYLYEFYEYDFYSTYKNTSFTPQLSLSHYIPIINNLYYYTRFTFGFGKETDRSKVIESIFRSNGDEPDVNYIENEVEYKHTIGSLTPNLIYFFSKHFAAQTSFGGVFYKKYKDAESSDISISILPSDWSFGIVFTL